MKAFRHVLFLFGLLGILIPANAQRNNVWFFGDSLFLDFSTAPPTLSRTANLKANQEACASICDESGNLLFYANHEAVYNSSLGPMLNGAGTVPSPFWVAFSGSLAQGVHILPISGQHSRYFLPWMRVDTLNSAYTIMLTLSEIDLAGDGGLGEVMAATKETVLCPDSLTEKLAAVKHANGEDWWLIGHTGASNTFIRWQLGADSIQGPLYQSIGQVDNPVFPGYHAYGEMVISQDGERLAYITPTNIIEFYALDRCTGTLSLLHQISDFKEFMVGSLFFGCSFSPSGRFLYVSEESEQECHLYQFDLSASDVKASRVEIWKTPFASFTNLIGHHELGPDGKIYMPIDPSSDTTSVPQSWLGVIHFPDLPGLACGFDPTAFTSTQYSFWYGLPNFPNYNLGPILPDQLANAGPDREGCPAAPHTLGTPDTTGGACQYSWSPTTGLSDPTSPMPTAAPTQPTTYVLTVTQPGKSACAVSHDTVTVNVVPCPPQFPNVFSPNGDGINDVFTVKDLPARTQLSVLDRWGNVVYHSEDYANNWGGLNVGGKDCPEGVYFWQAYPPGYKALAGHVTIVR